MFTLTAAMVKMRQGKARDMNNWLRARVIAQGFTIAAIVGGTYVFGQTKDEKQEQAARDQEALLSRAGFEARMRAAEEAHAVETGQRPASAAGLGENGEKGKGSGSGSWFGWQGGGGAKSCEKASSQKSEAASAVSPTVVAPPAVAGSPPPPAPAEVKQDASQSKSLWERIGLSGSGKS